MTDDECYICSEKCLMKSPCDCTNRFVHTSCLIKMINTSGKNECPVCLKNFNHIKVNMKVRKSCSLAGKVTIFACIAIFCSTFS